MTIRGDTLRAAFEAAPSVISAVMLSPFGHPLAIGDRRKQVDDVSVKWGHINAQFIADGRSQ